MRKTVKKPAKKAPAKPKLIDGRYSHKFLLRLEPDEGKALEAILSLTGNKTYNGAIKDILRSHSSNLEEIKRLQDELSTSKTKTWNYERAIQGFTRSWKDLSEATARVVEVRDGHKCPECEEEMEDPGSCDNCGWEADQ